jgi:hypothetical protein
MARLLLPQWCSPRYCSGPSEPQPSTAVSLRRPQIEHVLGYRSTLDEKGWPVCRYLSLADILSILSRQRGWCSVLVHYFRVPVPASTKSVQDQHYARCEQNVPDELEQCDEIVIYGRALDSV